MAVKQQYNIVGRYINEDDARDVVGYHLQSIDGTKQGRYSVEQVAFLVGREQVVNCTAQLYKDKVLFRGKGVALESLPVQKVAVKKSARTTDKNATQASVPASTARSNAGAQTTSHGQSQASGNMDRDTALAKALATNVAKNFKQRYKMEPTHIDVAHKGVEIQVAGVVGTSKLFGNIHTNALDNTCTRLMVQIGMNGRMKACEEITSNINVETVRQLLQRIYNEIDSQPELADPNKASSVSYAKKLIELFGRKYNTEIISEQYAQSCSQASLESNRFNKPIHVDLRVLSDGSMVNEIDIVVKVGNETDIREREYKVDSSISVLEIKRLIGRTYGKINNLLVA